MSWGNEELKNISFGDLRLDARAGNILTNLGDNPSLSIPAASASWSEAKATYNFFNNVKVDDKKILQAHQNELIKRAENESVLLCPQDTTELDYSSQKQNDAHGFLNSAHRKGTYVHGTIITTPERLPLGVLHVDTINRDKLRNQMDLEAKKIHDALPYEDKESYRWFEPYKASCHLASIVSEKQVISIGDRENDSYNFISSAQEIIDSGSPYADYIIRGNWDRTVQLDTEGEAKLLSYLQQQDVMAKINFILPERNGIPAREVKQEVRATSVKIKPTGKDADAKKAIEIRAILLTEVSPPSGFEPTQWLLLTNIAVQSKEDILQIIKYYLCRWDIEMFFKVLKSGCKIEELQIGAQGFNNCLTLYLIVAWRIMYITMLGRECPDLPCDVVFTDFEWQAVYMASKKEKPPENPPNLKVIVSMIASLGGFLNRKNDGDPGIKVMWLGMQRMADMALMLEVNSKVTDRDKTYG